jgi:hypothetical protein
MLFLALGVLAMSADATNCTICQNQLPYAYVQYLIYGRYHIDRGQRAMRQYCDSTYKGHEYDLCLAIAVDGYPDTVEDLYAGVDHNKICAQQGYCARSGFVMGVGEVTDELSDGIFDYLKGASSPKDFAKRLDDLKAVDSLLEGISDKDLQRMTVLLQKNAKRTFAWFLRALGDP